MGYLASARCHCNGNDDEAINSNQEALKSIKAFSAEPVGRKRDSDVVEGRVAPECFDDPDARRLAIEVRRDFSIRCPGVSDSALYPNDIGLLDASVVLRMEKSTVTLPVRRDRKITATTICQNSMVSLRENGQNRFKCFWDPAKTKRRDASESSASDTKLQSS